MSIIILLYHQVTFFKRLGVGPPSSVLPVGPLVFEIRRPTSVS